jgi:protein-S-isoprenylcysteine O-methyltransferase Ste14
MMKKFSYIKSMSFVLIQFACLGLIALSGTLIPANIALLAIELLGIGLGVWAVLTMRIGNFNITPDPLNDSQLVTSGPYRLIRHPMYLALLLTTLPLIIYSFDLFRFSIWMILFFDLLLKLNYEENLLVLKLVGYDGYIERSYRLIPYIY